MNRLWLCAYGQVRSVTAATLFGGYSAGLFNRYHADRKSPDKPSKIERLLDWADEVYIFNDERGTYNADHFKKTYVAHAHKVRLSFQIRDNYGVVGHPELVKKIREQMGENLWTELRL